MSNRGYIIGNTPLQREWTGSLWAEGSAWNGVGRYAVFSDIPNNRQMRWDEVTGEVTLLRTPSNFSNGNTFDWQGRQISCEHQTARVVRYEYEGEPTILAQTFEGRQLNAPNDAVAHPDDGGIIFTDPGYGSHWFYEGTVRELELPTSVYHIERGGALERAPEPAGPADDRGRRRRPGARRGADRQQRPAWRLGCARPLEDAARIAFEQMIHWLEDDFAIPAPEAYMLLGQIAEARCTQMVNPKYTFICKVSKRYLR